AGELGGGLVAQDVDGFGEHGSNLQEAKWGFGLRRWRDRDSRRERTGRLGAARGSVVVSRNGAEWQRISVGERRGVSPTCLRLQHVGLTPRRSPTRFAVKLGLFTAGWPAVAAAGSAAGPAAAGPCAPSPPRPGRPR